MDKIIELIEGLIKYIQELVAYFRAKNDGDEDAAMPEFNV